MKETQANEEIASQSISEAEKFKITKAKGEAEHLQTSEHEVLQKLKSEIKQDGTNFQASPNELADLLPSVGKV